MRRKFAILLGMLFVGAMPAGAQPDLAPREPVERILQEESVIGWETAAPRVRVWGNLDYLLWWYKAGPLPTPLVTIGSDADAFPAVMGQPGTSVLFGGTGLSYGNVNGLRLSAGADFGSEGMWGIEAGGLLLEQRSVRFQTASDANGVPTLGRPFLRAQSGAENALLISSNLFGAAGNVAINASSRLDGWEINFAANGFTQGPWQFRGLLGFRNLNLYESIAITQNTFDISGGFSALTFQGNQVSDPSSLQIFDKFHAANRFYGGQLGGRLDWEAGRFNVSVLAKVALGSTHQTVTIDGTTSVLTPGADTVSASGGLLAQPTNIGRYARDVFTVVPEANLNVGFKLTDWAQLRVGYSFLYWSRVVRPGDAIDRTVNSSLINADARFATEAGPNRPGFSFRGSDFWAHGVNFGLEFRY